LQYSLSGPQAVLFDLDGTLVDLRAVYIRAHQLAARDVLSLELEEERVLELMATGSPIRVHMGYLDEASSDDLVEAFVAHYRREREGLAQAFPGVTQLLERLRDRRMPVAVVTSKLREDAVTELAATGLDELIEVVIAFEDRRAQARCGAAARRAASSWRQQRRRCRRPARRRVVGAGRRPPRSRRCMGLRGRRRVTRGGRRTSLLDARSACGGARDDGLT
jgi:Haloacid dehalogenase-like hydrolase